MDRIEDIPAGRCPARDPPRDAPGRPYLIVMAGRPVRTGMLLRAAAPVAIHIANLSLRDFVVELNQNLYWESKY